MKKIICASVFLLFFGFVNAAWADMITIYDGRGMYTVGNRSSAFLGFSVHSDKRNQIIVTFGTEPYLCQDKWDREKAHKAANSIANYIDKNNDIDILKMLSEAGLSGCR